MSYKTLVIILLSLAAISCVESTPPQLLENDDPVVIKNEDNIIDMPEGIHWRKEIAIFEFEAEQAVNWNYEVEGRVLMPTDFADNIDGMKAGDVLVVWGGFIFFVKEVTTTAEGIEVLVKRFSVADAIYGEFDIPLVPPEMNSVGNVVTPNLELELSSFGIFPDDIEAKVTAKMEFPISADGGFKGKIPYAENYSCEGETIYGYCVDYLMAKITFEFDGKLDGEFVFKSGIEFATADPPPSIALIDTLNSKVPRITLGATGLAIQPFFEIPREVKLSALAKAEFKAAATAHAELPIGFEYFNEGYQGHPNSKFEWIPNANHPVTFSHEFTASAALTGEIVYSSHIGIGIGFRIVPAVSSSVGLSGLGFAATMNTEVKYKPFEDNDCLTANVKMKFDAKAQIKFFIDGWTGLWEWSLLDRVGSEQGGVVKGTIQILPPIELADYKSGTDYCLNADGATKLRITKIKDEPIGLEDPLGFDLDAVQVSRRNGQMTETWEATSATGAGNSNAAIGVPDARTCAEFESKVAAVTNSITLTFSKSFKPDDVVNIFQFLPGNEIGLGGDCFGSGSIKLEVGNGTKWNTVTEEVSSATATISGSHLTF